MRTLLLPALVVALLGGCGRGSGKPREVTAGSAVVAPPRTADLPAHLAHADRSIRVGFWLGVNNNEILTPAMIDWIGERASIVVLNAEEQGPDPYFDYRECARRFKERFPNLPVLLYSTAQRLNRTTKVYGAYFDEVTRSPWLLKKPAGDPVIQKGTRALVDITNPDFRKYLPNAVGKDVVRTGTDGIAFDGYHGTLALGRAKPEYYQNGESIFAGWPAAARDLLANVKTKMGDGRLVIFNGLWSRFEGELANQAKLLAVADGAAVEFFGYDVREPEVPRDAEFQRYVLDILDTMATAPDKLYLVFGRTRRRAYMDYAQDYQVQRYDLASYLLGATPGSTFKYNAHFQTMHMPPDRADGMSYYADWDLDLGQPAGARVATGGGYTRAFSKGLVAVAPAWRSEVVLHLDHAYYTPEGKRLEGEQRLPPGSALILLTEAPTAPPNRVLVDDFESQEPGMWKLPVHDDATAIATEKTNHYLQVRPSADALQSYHERLVQPVRRLDGYDQLSLKLRTSDLDGAILVRVEVDDATPVAAAAPAADDDDDGGGDDAPRPAMSPASPPLNAKGRPRAQRGGPRPYAVLVLTPRGGSARYRKRDHDIPYGELKARGLVPYLRVADAYQASGTWQNVTVDARVLVPSLAPELTARRISEVRIMGSADLDDVKLMR